MKFKVTILSTMICVFGGFTTAGMAEGGHATAMEDQALILEEFDRLYVETPVAADLAVMNVKVFGPDNELLLSERSTGESVEFLVGHLPDGEYIYETVSIFGNIDLNSRVSHSESDRTTVRKFGTFRVVGGQISFAKAPGDEQLESDASLLDGIIENAVNLAGLALDFLIPSAQAADLTIADTSPKLYYNDESTVSGIDWALEGSTAADDLSGWFILESWVNGNSQDVITVNSDDTTNNADSLVVDGDGDLHFANNQLNFDRGTSNLSIGTTANLDSIHVSDGFPGIRLYDNFWAKYAGLENEGLDVYIFGASNQRIAQFGTDAPANSIRVLNSGYVGLGTSSPTVLLDVVSSEGTGQVQVTESNGTNTARHLFRGKNNGPALFSLKDTSTSRTWAFTVVPEGFTMSRQGSGVKEFLIFNNGDAELQGTLVQLSDKNSKQDVEPVDSQNILEKIAQLEISEWSYKDSPDNRHIGPMSQDFYKAFGLGGKKGVKGISTLDSSGVALAAIQALIQENDSLKAQNEALNERLGLVERQQVEMQAVMMKVLENQSPQNVLTSTVLN